MSNVKLRTRPLKNNKQSLFLDYYPPLLDPASGKAKRFVNLKLYLFIRPENEFQRKHNKHTLTAANTICAQRQIELQNRRFGMISEQEREASFVDMFRQIARQRRQGIHDHGKCLYAISSLSVEEIYFQSSPIIFARILKIIC